MSVKYVVISDRDADDVRGKAVDIIRDSGRYIAEHAEDFVSRAGSDEIMIADGLDLIIHVKTVNDAPTIEVRRDMFVIADRGD